MDSHSALSLTAIDGADFEENLASSSSSGSIKTEQWSPLKPEGRRQYDRDLLLQLQYSKQSMEKPDSLQHFPEINPDEFVDSIQEEEPMNMRTSRVNDAGLLPGNIASPEGNQPLLGTLQAEPSILAAPPLPWCDLDPEKVVQVLSRLKNPEGGDVEILMVIPALKSSGDETKKEEVMKSPGVEAKKEKEKLVKGSVEEQGTTNEGKKDETKEQKNETRKKFTLSQDERQLYRKVRSILNKLTPQKFQTLIKQVEGLVIDTESKLKGVTSLIWEQATRDTAYAKEYASLCTHLMQVEVPSEQKEGEHLRFRTALLIFCRKGFTEIINYAQNIDEHIFSNDIIKYRRKYVGIVRFMGELFQHEMLLEKIIIDCLSKLLQSGNGILLECFCQLMFVVGETLDHRNKVDDYFQQIQEIIREKNVSTKCCFLLQDVIDLRDNKWNTLRDQYTPVTIDEVHEQVNLEEIRRVKWEVNQVPMWRPVIVIEPPPTRVPLSGQPFPLPDRSTVASDLTKLPNHECRIYESPTAWSRGTPRLEFGEPEEEVYRKVRSILNKLTPLKFQTLIKQVQGLVIDTETKLKGVTDIIYEKAISETAFSVAYANMCRYLLTLKVPSDTKPGESVNFRVILLTRCQREFEKDKDTQLDLDRRKKDIEEATDQKKAAEMKEELDQAITNARRRSIGNIRFIGELFKLKMLTKTIMHDCVFKLLRSRDEDNLECLCRLLTTIGKELDSEKAKPRMDQYFQQMKKIVSEKKVSSRCRFMLQDVIDLRDDSWKPRRDENNPKTIDQIHKDARREAVEQNMLTALHMAQQPSQPQHHQSRIAQGRPSGHTRGSIEYIKAIRERTIDIKNADKNIEFTFRGGFGRGSSGSRFEEGSMSKAPGKRFSALSKEDDQRSRALQRVMSPVRGEGCVLGKQPGGDFKKADENIQLGPARSFGGWGRGTSGGGSRASQEGEKPKAPGNRFSALSKEDDQRSRAFGRGVSPVRGEGRMRGNQPGGGFNRGKVIPRSSQEQERERALASARSLMSGGRTTPPSGTTSREGSRNREGATHEMERPPAPVRELSEDEMEKKTLSIVDEYLHIQDRKETIQCVQELNSPKTIHFFVYFAINHVLEKTKQARQQTGHLLHDLINQKVISVDTYFQGLTEILQAAEDMEIDIPKIWLYLGELIGPMIQDGSVPLSFLTKACEPLKASGKAGNLMAEVLHDASQRLGHKIVAHLWRNNTMDWTDFVHQEKLQQFLKDKNLEFTVGPDSAPSTPTSKVSLEWITQNLTELLNDPKCDTEKTFDWIEANIPDEITKENKFIRALMSSVCSSAISGSGNAARVDPEVVKKWRSLLIKYLDHSPVFELQALYALQALVNSLEHPSGVLRSFFDTLYDDEIISEDAFNQWETSKEEPEGMGLALKQVVQFFAWLREGEEDDSDI